MCIIHILTQFTYPICLSVPYGLSFVTPNYPLLQHFHRQLRVYVPPPPYTHSFSPVIPKMAPECELFDNACYSCPYNLPERF